MHWRKKIHLNLTKSLKWIMASGGGVLAEAAAQIDLAGKQKVILPSSPTLVSGRERDPWPSDAELYQPLDVEQILLSDNACCLAVQAFLRMAKLDFTVQQRANAEHMSPSGRVPFIRAGQFVIAELVS